MEAYQTESSTDISNEVWQIVKSQEDKRKLQSSTIYLRNRAYWRELSKYQKEGLEDAEQLARMMKTKHTMLAQYGEILKQSEQALAKPGTAQPSNRSKQSDNQNSRKSAGYLASKALLTLDESLAKVVIEASKSIETVILPAFSDKLRSYQQEVEKLSDHARVLFLAWILLDGRVHASYEKLQQAIFSLPSTPLSPSSQATPVADPDKWLLYLQYTISVQKFDQLMSHCYSKFRMLFKVAKELEAARRTSVARAAEVLVKKLMEIPQQDVLFHTSALSTISGIPQVLSTQERPLSEELTARVQANTPERANFSLYADYLLHTVASTGSDKGHGQSEVSKEHARAGGAGDMPMSPDGTVAGRQSPIQATATSTMDSNLHPLQSTWLQRVFLCYKGESTLLYGYLWCPVMLAVTASGCIHVMDLPNINPNIHQKVGIISAYQSYISSNSKLCFEEDLVRPVDPTLQQATGIGSGIGHRIVDNPLFEQLVSKVTWRDIEINNKEVLNSTVDQYLMADNKFIQPSASLSIKHCTFCFQPSADSSENVLQIVERVPQHSLLSDMTLGVWGSSIEHSLSVKCRTQEDAIEMMSMLDRFAKAV